jgi:16S rRNA (cytidine1402-2'-O)-methyltransferase
MASTMGKLYLIPTTMGDCDPMDVLPQTIKSIDLIDSYIVENKTARNQSKLLIQKKSRFKTVYFKQTPRPKTFRFY